MIVPITIRFTPITIRIAPITAGNTGITAVPVRITNRKYLITAGGIAITMVIGAILLAYSNHCCDRRSFNGDCSDLDEDCSDPTTIATKLSGSEPILLVIATEPTVIIPGPIVIGGKSIEIAADPAGSLPDHLVQSRSC
jgi:hypothetical protein